MPNNQKPLVSLILLGFNQGKHVAKAVESVLNQTYNNLEFIFSDDCSSDNTFELMESVTKSYNGTSKILLNKNPSNLGVIRHLNYTMSLTSGELIVLAAADDIAYPQRIEKIVQAYIDNDKPTLIHSKAKEIDLDGKHTGNEKPSPRLRKGMDSKEAATADSIFLGASGAWTRDVFDTFGPMKQSETYEDLVIGFRAPLIGDVVFIDENLLDYRIGDGASTTRSSDIEGAIEFRIRQMQIFIGAYLQRKTDAKLLGNNKDLIDDIELAVIKHLGRSAALQANQGTLKKLLNLVKGFLAEINKIRKTKSRYQ